MSQTGSTRKVYSGLHLAHRFNVREALRHKRRYLENKGSKYGVPGKLLSYLDAAFHACWQDKYGVLEKDVIIMGNDHLMNILAAYLVATRGFSALIIDEYTSPDPVLELRFGMIYPGMDALLCASLGIEHDERLSLINTLAQKIRACLDADGNPLVHQLDRSTLMHEQGDSSLHGFWAEPTDQVSFDLGVDRFRFWDTEKLAIFGTEVGKCPQYRAVFKRIILTSYCQYSRLTGIDIPTVALGDAKTPLSDFEYYRGSDRLRELLEAIRAIIHGQDFSTANQHNA